MQPFTQTPYLQPSISCPHSWTLHNLLSAIRSYACLLVGAFRLSVRFYGVREKKSEGYA